MASSITFLKKKHLLEVRRSKSFYINTSLSSAWFEIMRCSSPLYFNSVTHRLLSACRTNSAGRYSITSKEINMCSPTRYKKRFNEWVYSSRMLARHVSDLAGPSSGAFYKLYLQIWYVVLLCVLLDTSSRYCWTCRVVRVLPHTKSANTACKRHSWWWTDEVRNM